MHRAGELRREQTPAEVRLWARLRRNQLNGVSFRRQHALGQYVVDFCSPSKKLVIELDGSQHIDQAEYDSDRTAYLESQGYRVLRLWNSEVEQDIDAVMRGIANLLEDSD